MWFTSAGQAPAADSRASSGSALPLASLSFSIGAREQQPQQNQPHQPQRFCMRGRAPLPLASVHASSSAAAAAGGASEEHTGVAFPGDFCVHTRSQCPELTGTG
jgi:hypothetical protein